MIHYINTNSTTSWDSLWTSIVTPLPVQRLASGASIPYSDPNNWAQILSVGWAKDVVKNEPGYDPSNQVATGTRMAEILYDWAVEALTTGRNGDPAAQVVWIDEIKPYVPYNPAVPDDPNYGVAHACWYLAYNFTHNPGLFSGRWGFFIVDPSDGNYGADIPTPGACFDSIYWVLRGWGALAVEAYVGRGFYLNKKLLLGEHGADVELTKFAYQGSHGYGLHWLRNVRTYYGSPSPIFPVEGAMDSILSTDANAGSYMIGRTIWAWKVLPGQLWGPDVGQQELRTSKYGIGSFVWNNLGGGRGTIVAARDHHFQSHWNWYLPDATWGSRITPTTTVI